MAGHSQFSNIKHRKEAQDKKRAKIFTRLLKDISVAAKLGQDPEQNSQLRRAWDTARMHNIPKERMLKAVSSAKSTLPHDTIFYEAFGPEGVAFMIEAYTDNKNRTATDVRTLLGKHGARLGNRGSVECLMESKGCIVYDIPPATEEEIFSVVASVASGDYSLAQNTLKIWVNKEDLKHAIDHVTRTWSFPSECALTWVPYQYKDVQDEKNLEKIHHLMTMLEALDDIQGVWSDLAEHTS